MRRLTLRECIWPHLRQALPKSPKRSWEKPYANVSRCQIGKEGPWDSHRNITRQWTRTYSCKSFRSWMLRAPRMVTLFRTSLILLIRDTTIPLNRKRMNPTTMTMTKSLRLLLQFPRSKRWPNRDSSRAINRNLTSNIQITTTTLTTTTITTDNTTTIAMPVVIRAGVLTSSSQAPSSNPRWLLEDSVLTSTSRSWPRCSIREMLIARLLRSLTAIWHVPRLSRRTGCSSRQI